MAEINKGERWNGNKMIVVAEFEKPTKCEDCPCFYKTEGAFYDECQLTHKEIENWSIIDKSCPLRGVNNE